MSSYGVLALVEDHETDHNMTNAHRSSSITCFKYPELISHRKQAKHWVNDTNNCRYDPIAISAVQRTKQWPNRRFTFLLKVAEANAANSIAWSMKVKAETHFAVYQALAQNKLTNNLDYNRTKLTKIECLRTW